MSDGVLTYEGFCASALMALASPYGSPWGAHLHMGPPLSVCDACGEWGGERAWTCPDALARLAPFYAQPRVPRGVWDGG
jgi:hypothetical protein